MRVEETIKTCPFCDGQGKPVKALRDGYRDGQEEAYAHYVYCRSCAAQGGWAKTPTGAVRTWNMRQREPQPDSALEGEQLRGMIQARSAAVGSQKALARDMGVSDQYITDILRGRRAPGPKILKHFGLERVVGYRRIDGSSGSMEKEKHNGNANALSEVR